MKSVLISIQPKWVEKIVKGEKTIEVRKTAPKEVPFKAYIYCTKAKEQNDIIWAGAFGDRGKWNGHIIGEFVCDRVVKYDYQVIACAKYEVNGAYVKEELRYNAGACLTAEEMFSYSKGKTLYGWRISDLKIYDKPKELYELNRPCPDKFHYCDICKYGSVVLSPDEEEYALYHGGHYDTYETVCRNRVTRPPQSWCYVEKQDND